MTQEQTAWYDRISRLYDTTENANALMGALMFYLGDSYKATDAYEDKRGPWAMVVIDEGDTPQQYLKAKNEEAARAMLATQFLIYCLGKGHQPQAEDLYELAAVLDGHANGLSAGGDGHTDYFFVTQQVPG